MNRFGLRSLQLLAPLSALLLFPACGGGGGERTPGISVVATPVAAGIAATFTPGAVVPAGATAVVRMTPGTAAGSTFNIEVRISGVTDFFGAAFHVLFDPTVSQFIGFSPDPTAPGYIPGGMESFIDTPGVFVDIRADQFTPGDLTVVATRSGQVAGITPAGSELLIRLTFNALRATGASAFNFGAPQNVQVCPGGAFPLPACSMFTAGLGYAGGTLTAN